LLSSEDGETLWLTYYFKKRKLTVYCMSKSTTDIFSKLKDEGYYSNLIGRYGMDGEMKYREYFGVSKDFSSLFIL
jgi:hypothetical protein